MRSFHCLALLALPLLARVAAEEPAEEPVAPPPKPTRNSPSSYYDSASDTFQELLNALPEESLHVALNSLTHFRDGIFESDRQGVERVHHENAPLASKLIVAAVQDLKKRQAGPSNGTTPSTPTPGSSSEAPPESTDAPAQESSAVIVPVPISTTDAEGKPTVVSSEILSQATASVAVPVTKTNANGETEVATETKPAVIFTATDTAGSAFVTTSAVDFAPTAGEVLTKVDSRGSVFLTTYTPGGGRVSSIVLITTTGPNGEQQIITSYTYVDPAAATGSGGAGSPTNTAKPGLQSGAAIRNFGVDAAMVGGAVGVALAFFL